MPGGMNPQSKTGPRRAAETEPRVSCEHIELATDIVLAV